LIFFSFLFSQVLFIYECCLKSEYFFNLLMSWVYPNLVKGHVFSTCSMLYWGSTQEYILLFNVWVPIECFYHDSSCWFFQLPFFSWANAFIFCKVYLVKQQKKKKFLLKHEPQIRILFSLWVKNTIKRFTQVNGHFLKYFLYVLKIINETW
jgi:hypothetical protein